MSSYALLLAPSASRVYAAEAPRLALVEAAALTAAFLDRPAHDVRTQTVAGVDYLCLDTDAEPDAVGRALGNLSSAYALYRIEGELLRPVPLLSSARFASDLLTIQKYPGKTNEQFTHLLFNLTACASARPDDLLTGRLRVLDPLCGRGTTLNRAVMYGADAAGVDIDHKDIESYATFVRTWAKNHRLPHTADYGPVRRHKQVVAHRLTMRLYADRAAQKADDGIGLEAVADDTSTCAEYFGESRFDLVVADLPYGVEHGSRSGATLARRPADLLTAALPIWVSTLRAGGALGLSFNTKVLRRDDLLSALTEVGLQPVEHPDVAHRVDSSIRRDLVVARRG